MDQIGCRVLFQLAAGVHHCLDYYGFASFFLGFAVDWALSYLVNRRSVEIDWSPVNRFLVDPPTALPTVKYTPWRKLLSRRRRDMREGG